jgi:hypothetical protein
MRRKHDEELPTHNAGALAETQPTRFSKSHKGCSLPGAILFLGLVFQWAIFLGKHVYEANKL